MSAGLGNADVEFGVDAAPEPRVKAAQRTVDGHARHLTTGGTGSIAVCQRRSQQNTPGDSQPGRRATSFALAHGGRDTLATIRIALSACRVADHGRSVGEVALIG